MSANNQASGSLPAGELYRLALDTRNFEIKLFWERSNYFLVLSTAAAVGFFTTDSAGEEIALALFGILISFLWFRVNLGSKFWQSRWEARLAILEKGLAPEAHLFAAPPEVIRGDVEASFGSGAHGSARKWLNGLILEKPSVSITMFMLSGVFAGLWFVLLLISIVKLVL